VNWISVDEMMPRLGAKVLIYAPRECETPMTAELVMLYDQLQWCAPEVCNDTIYADEAVVTHWMPLPPSPGEARRPEVPDWTFDEPIGTVEYFDGVTTREIPIHSIDELPKGLGLFYSYMPRICPNDEPPATPTE
jgi:hypothetical protein